MKYILIIAIVFLSEISFGQTISIDTKDASVSFYFISEKTKGTLAGVEVKLTVDPADLLSGVVSGSVDVSTLSTKNKMRDKHLKSDDFFDVKKYPKMTFTGSSIYQEGDKYKAKGFLTIKAIKKEVIFDLKNTGSELIFSTTIYALDFDVSTKKNRDKSKVKITVTVPISE